MLFADMIPEISPWHQIHHQVKCVPVLESLAHIDNEFVFEPREELSFISDGLVAFLGEDSR